MKRTSFLVLLVIAICQAAPAKDEPVYSGIPPLISFKDGIIGVNFLGFHAAAGINPSGRLHAEAGTPFGQRAAAGINGMIGENGRLGGSLYAGATAGGNVKAAAGLGGEIKDGKGVGTLYSGASALNANAGTSLDGDSNKGITRNRVVNGVQLQSPEEEEVIISKKSKGKKVIELSNDTPKKVDLISNETPKESHSSEEEGNGKLVVSKVTHVRGHPVKFDRFLNHKAVLEQRRKEEQTPVVITKRVQLDQVDEDENENTNSKPQSDSPANFGSNFLRGFLSPEYSPPVSRVTKSTGESTYSVQKSSTFFDDIFNIPISTLGAVNRFLSNSAGSVKVAQKEIY